ncbi:MAG: hypothetical protein FIA92_00875 [Chloroflexi bacterium]|nr:hypothetical protein [Chloroflexota bacterium]
MIVRALRLRVARPRVATFNALMRRQLALMREQPGLIYVRLARRILGDGGEEAILFEEWADADSLYAWVGPRLTEPRLVAGARELTEEIAVAHYEMLPEEGERDDAVDDQLPADVATPEFEGRAPGG